jgi:hypothetical protein
MSEIITKEQKWAGFRETSAENEALYQQDKVGVIVLNKEGTIFTPTEITISDFEENYIVCTPNDKKQKNQYGLQHPGWCYVITREDADELVEHHQTGIGPNIELE